MPASTCIRGASTASSTPSPRAATFATTWRSAPCSRLLPAEPRTRRGSPSRNQTEGAMSDLSRAPGRSPPVRWVSPSMLLRWMPVPGTTMPLAEPSEHERDAAFPSPSTALMWVVPPASSAWRASSCAPLAPQPCERVRELRNREPLPGAEGAARPVERVAVRRVAEQRIEDPVEIGLRLVEDDAVAREPHRRREQLRPRHGSPAAMSFPEPERDTRHCDRRRPGKEDLL